MNKKVLIALISIVILLSSGITVLALSKSTEEGYDSLLTEAIDKFTPINIGKRLNSITKSTDKAVEKYGDITVSAFEMEDTKYKEEMLADSDKKPRVVSDEEAIDIVLKEKLLIQDAKSKGLSVPYDKVEWFLKGTRDGYTFDGQGLVTSNEGFREILVNAGLTYDEYEKRFLRNDAEYYFLREKYLDFLCKENGLDREKDVDRVYEMLDNRLNSLLTELKKNSK